MRDGHDEIFIAAFEIVRAIRADGVRLEIDFRAELAGGVLQPEAERRRGFPIHKQQVFPPVAIHVHDLHGLGRAGIRDFLRFAKRMVGLLRQKMQRAVVAEQNDVGQAVAVQIAGDERVGIHAPVLDVPALRLAPAVCALVVNDFQILASP